MVLTVYVTRGYETRNAGGATKQGLPYAQGMLALITGLITAGMSETTDQAYCMARGRFHHDFKGT